MNRKGVRTEKLRIAMFGHKRIPSREGGIEVVVEELSTRLVAKGCSVTCYNRSGHNVAGAEYDRADSDEFRGVKLKKVFTIDHRGFAALTASVTASIGPRWEIMMWYIFMRKGRRSCAGCRGCLENVWL